MIEQTSEDVFPSDGWHDLAVDIILTAVEDASAGDSEAHDSLQPGEFCYRLAGYLGVDPDLLLELDDLAHA